MDGYEYVVITNRIAVIQQEQLQILNYIDANLDKMVEQQKENMQELMLALQAEKLQLEKLLTGNISGNA